MCQALHSLPLSCLGIIRLQCSWTFWTYENCVSLTESEAGCCNLDEYLDSDSMCRQ